MTKGPHLGALFGSPAPSTFLGLPACYDLQHLKAAIALIGAPCASPYESVGAYCRHAPNALRAAAAPLAANLTHHDFDSDGPLLGDVAAVDCGDLAFDETK